MDYAGNVAVFLGPFTNALMWRVKEMIDGGSQMDLSLTNFCKLTCHLSSSQTCKNFSEKLAVLLLAFLLSVSKIWCHQD